MNVSILGTVIFLLIAGMAMWLLSFLLTFVLPYWIMQGTIELLRPKKVFDDEIEDEVEEEK